MNETQLEREEEHIERDYAEGRISAKERNEALRELHADYRAAAQEAAHEAYYRELDRW